MGKQETGAGPGSARGESSSVGPAAPTNLGVDPPDADQARNRSDVLSSRNRPAGPGTDPRPGGRFDFIKMVEAVGIEPTSGNPQQQASTSIAGSLVLSPPLPPTGWLSGRPAPRRSRPLPKSGAWGQSPEYDVRTRAPMTRPGGR